VADIATRLLTKWQRRARDRSQLAALDDRILADIGISRDEAELNHCQMLTLGKFAVLGAVFLSGAAIAANADPLRPANPGAVGTVANAAVSFPSPGPQVAALPPANTAAPNSVTLPEVSVFGVAMHPYTSHPGPKASPNGTLRMDH